jgi:PIN domain nuclease of toxin-antitoxin system
VRLLLDTHVAIWVLTEPKRIPARLMTMIGDTDNAISVSAIAIWEIAIKYRLRRPDSPPFSGHDAIGHFETAGFSLINATPAHAAFVERLPLLHGDPFDRLMLAQAILENMQFVTFDRRLARYDLGILTWP